jgi:hypothetical protein
VEWLYVVGPGLAALAVGAGSAYLIVRRLDVAILAGVAAVATWLVFLSDWVIYSIGENGPVYYAFSAYAKYRDAVDGFAGLVVGAGYALLAASVVVAGALLARRSRVVWVIAAPAMICATVLPALVPSVLPRVEWGKDRVLYEVPAVAGDACFNYGVEVPGRRAAVRKPTLCVLLRSGIDRDEAWLQLNEAGIEPYDDVDVDAVARAHWLGRPGSL